MEYASRISVFLYILNHCKASLKNQSIHNICFLNDTFSVFSSPEPKAQVSFSDQNLSVVRRRRCCRHCRRKIFTFSSFSPEPLGQFQPNLAQSYLG